MASYILQTPPWVTAAWSNAASEQIFLHNFPVLILGVIIVVVSCYCYGGKQSQLSCSLIKGGVLRG